MAAFILGQHPFRTGLLTIGMPGSTQGIKDNQATIAGEFLATFKKFPAVGGSSLGIDKVVQSLTAHPIAQ